ncbi:MAG: permease [Candidatus Micrarchaeia archaeon]
MLEDFGAWVAFQLLKLEPGSQLGEAVNFFVYDSLKVLLLLVVMVFLVGIIRTYVTPQKVKKWLGGKKEGAGNVLAALLGVPTPFCSCSAVPLFIGFVESGVPLGITFSFLISSPMVNEVAIALLLGLVGWQITGLYILSGLSVAVVAGILIGRMNLEKEVEDFVYEIRSKEIKEKQMTLNERIEFAKNEVKIIMKKVSPYVLIAIGVGAFIHGYVPVGFLAEIAGKDNPLAVPIAVMIGIPLYSNAAGTIPIVQALMSKGMAVGTALAFMMSVTALSFPEMLVLRRVLKPKLIAIFVGILFVAIMLVGLLFNAIIG